MSNPTAPAAPFRLSTQACLQASLLALGGTLTAGFAAPALGITYLDPKHAPFHITKAQTGIATSVGSLEVRAPAGGADLTNGGFRRQGQASGVVLDAGDNSSWFITSGHMLAPVGRFDEDPLSSFPSVTFSFDPVYDTANAITISDWYVSSFFGDSAGNTIQPGDIAMVRLPYSPAELDALGVAQVPIFTRDTDAQFIADTQGKVVEIVGFGESGNGATGSAFDGVRRWGQNRFEPWLDGVQRVATNQNSLVFEMDFDVDRDDDLYDDTPETFLDKNLLREGFYQIKNTGEYVVSGSVEERQVPEEDFRVPFEVGVAPGDSGGGVFLGGALVGLPTSVRGVPLDEDGDDDEDAFGFGFNSEAQFITLNALVPFIEDLVLFTEIAEQDFVLGSREEPLLTDEELLSLGWRYGATDLNPIFNYTDQVEINDRRGNAVDEEEEGGGDGAVTGVNGFNVGPEVQMAALEVSYYAGEQLSPVTKAKLIGAVPITAPDDLSDEDLIALIGNPALTDIESLKDALDADLVLFYGEPTIDRAIQASRSLNYIATNFDAPARGTDGFSKLRDAVGDYNNDGSFNADDIDAFIDQVNAEGDNPWADLNEDGTTDDLDTAVFVESLLGLLMGDANLDGTVDQADLDAVLVGWGQDGLGWADGNFGGQDEVDQYDLDAILTNWGSSIAPNFQGLNVPEPASLTLLGLGAAAMLRRRTR